MEISKLSASIATTKTNKTEGKVEIVETNSTLTAETNKTSISPDWKLLETSKQDLKHTDDVDLEKVAALKQALKDGTFDIDASQIASAMLKQHGAYGYKA